jgi:DNA-binding MarR family transcriptional regulator
MGTAQGETPHLDTIHKFLTLYRYLRKYSRRLHEQGISGRTVAALRYLLEAGPVTIGQLRDYLYISHSTTSELVARMAKMGYVTRTRSEADNRVVFVDLTPSGREIADQTSLGGIPLLREKLKSLPPERLAAIDEAMAEMLRLLEIAR